MRNERSCHGYHLLLCLLALLVISPVHGQAPFPVPNHGNGGDRQPPRSQEQLESAVHKGRVIQTMDAGGYTYVEFEEKGKKLWVAAPAYAVKEGDTIEFSRAATMRNFMSKTLNRTFEIILFVSRVVVNGVDDPQDTDSALPEGHQPVKRMSTKTLTVSPGSVKKAEKGFTVQECHSRKGELAGKKIKIRGIVVKFTQKIMNRNWIHLQDGTGNPDDHTNDLTVTSKDIVKVGDLVLVNGKMTVDKDLGSGYFFPVIIENANIKVEKK